MSKQRKCVLVSISNEMFVDLKGDELYVSIQGLPPDCIPVGFYYDERFNCMKVGFYHETFQPVEVGMLPPEVNVNFKVGRDPITNEPVGDVFEPLRRMCELRDRVSHVILDSDDLKDVIIITRHGELPIGKRPWDESEVAA